MQKKYEFTDETIEYYGIILHRIRAVRDFGNVNAGNLGGFIEKEWNLSHEDSCWVYDDALVYGSARVCGKTRICGHAQVFDDGLICGRVCIC